MNDGFLATVAFARQVLLALLVSCLVVWTFGGHSLWAGYGALFSILAMGLAYGAQHCFHFQDSYAEMAREPVRKENDPERIQACQFLADRSGAIGNGLQVASIAAAVLAGLFLWVAL